MDLNGEQAEVSPHIGRQGVLCRTRLLGSCFADVKMAFPIFRVCGHQGPLTFLRGGFCVHLALASGPTLSCVYMYVCLSVCPSVSGNNQAVCTHVFVCICICVLECMCCLAHECRCEKVRRTTWWENNSLVFHLFCLVPSYLFHALSHTLPCLYSHQ